MTSCTDIQIKNAFEKESMTPEQISSDLGYEVVAVKAKLMQISSLYRKACGIESPEEDELNFTNDELKQVNRVIFDSAMQAEDENLRFKAACYIRDDKKGRKEIVRATQNNATFNVLNFNESLKEARQAMANIGLRSQQSIDVKAA